MSTRAIFAASFAICALVATAATATTVTYTFSTTLDGEDYLLIQGDTLSWQHVSYVPVDTTSVQTTLDGSQVQNFTWSNTGPYSGLSPALPDDPQNVMLDVIEARYSLSILEYPSLSDNYTLGLDFNDGPISGSATYTAEISFTTSVPEPSAWTLTLLGAGATGGFLRTTRRRSLVSGGRTA
jgi:hypothetical protein